MLKLLADLYNPLSRHQSAIKLAEYCGAVYFMIFIKDPKINVYLPGPGFMKTLYGSHAWDNFLLEASENTYSAKLNFPNKFSNCKTVGFPGPQESIVTFIGVDTIPDNIDPLIQLLPLIISLLKQEQSLIATRGLSETLEKEIIKAEKLSRKLEIAGQSLRKNLLAQQKDKEAISQLMQKKDEFMNIASHELKTPITSMKAYLQLVSQKILPVIKDQQLSLFIEKANKQVDKLVGLINDLLDVTKIQAGKMDYIFSTFNISEVIKDSVEEAKSTTATHDFVIELEEDVNITGDKMRIEQVLTNFLSNAIKYSPEGKQVIIKLIKEDSRVKISVKDYGIGIEEDQLAYIFDRFFRVESNINKFFGLGLGLYISTEVIKRHQGTFGVESKHNEGSTFWFAIPVTYS
jgi:signal transduction histidine kinase